METAIIVVTVAGVVLLLLLVLVFLWLWRRRRIQGRASPASERGCGTAGSTPMTPIQGGASEGTARGGARGIRAPLGDASEEAQEGAPARAMGSVGSSSTLDSGVSGEGEETSGLGSSSTSGLSDDRLGALAEPETKLPRAASEAAAQVQSSPRGTAASLQSSHSVILPVCSPTEGIPLSVALPLGLGVHSSMDEVRAWIDTIPGLHHDYGDIFEDMGIGGALLFDDGVSLGQLRERLQRIVHEDNDLVILVAAVGAARWRISVKSPAQSIGGWIDDILDNAAKRRPLYGPSFVAHHVDGALLFHMTPEELAGLLSKLIPDSADRNHIEMALHAVALNAIGPHSSPAEVARWLESVSGLSRDYAPVFERHSVTGGQLFSGIETTSGRGRDLVKQLVRDPHDCSILMAAVNAVVLGIGPQSSAVAIQVWIDSIPGLHATWGQFFHEHNVTGHSLFSSPGASRRALLDKIVATATHEHLTHHPAGLTTSERDLQNKDRRVMLHAIDSIVMRLLGAHSTVNDIATWVHDLHTDQNKLSQDYSKHFLDHAVDGATLFDAPAPRVTAILNDLIHHPRDRAVLLAEIISLRARANALHQPKSSLSRPTLPAAGSPGSSPTLTTAATATTSATSHHRPIAASPFSLRQPAVKAERHLRRDLARQQNVVGGVPSLRAATIGSGFQTKRSNNNRSLSLSEQQRLYELEWSRVNEKQEWAQIQQTKLLRKFLIGELEQFHLQERAASQQQRRDILAILARLCAKQVRRRRRLQKQRALRREQLLRDPSMASVNQDNDIRFAALLDDVRRGESHLLATSSLEHKQQLETQRSIQDIEREHARSKHQQRQALLNADIQAFQHRHQKGRDLRQQRDQTQRAIEPRASLHWPSLTPP